jgi:hypothetical protein
MMNARELYKDVVKELKVDDLSMPRDVLYPLVKEYIRLSKDRNVCRSIVVRLVWDEFDTYRVSKLYLDSQIEEVTRKHIKSANKELKAFFEQCDKATKKYLAPHYSLPGCEPTIDVIIMEVPWR